MSTTRRPLRVTFAPHHALGVGGHQLAVAVEHGAVGADGDERVVDGRTAERSFAFVDATHDGHPGAGGGVPRRREPVGIEIDAFASSAAWISDVSA